MIYAQSLLEKQEPEEDKRVDDIVENAEIIWNDIDAWPVLFNPAEDEFLGDWHEKRGSTLRISRSGSLFLVEWEDKLSKITGVSPRFSGVTCCSVRKETKQGSPGAGAFESTILGAGTGLLSAGPFNAGHFIILLGQQGLRVLHVDDSTNYRLIGRRDYTKAAVGKDATV